MYHSKIEFNILFQSEFLKGLYFDSCILAAWLEVYYYMFFQTFVVSFIHNNSSFFFTLTGDYGASDSESSLGFQTFTVPIVRLHFLCHLHCCTGTRSFTFCFMYLILVKSGISVDILNLVICMFQTTYILKWTTR